MLRALTEGDVAVLSQLLADFKARRLNTGGRAGVDLDDGTSPEVYVAKAPAGGIAAIGTDETGTGTLFDVPASGVCNVYQLVQGEKAALELEQVPGLSFTVYNLSTTTVVANAWILVQRDKWGIWFTVGLPTHTPTVYVALTPSGGIGAASYVHETGSGTLTEPNSATCTVWKRVAGDDDLEPTGISVTVYNLSTTAVPGSTMVLVAQDEYGTWYVTGPYVLSVCSLLHALPGYTTSGGTSTNATQVLGHDGAGNCRWYDVGTC